MKNKIKYTDDQFIDAVMNSQSYRQALMKLGLKEAGGNYSVLKKRIESMGLDISHMTGKSHLKGKTHNYNKKPIDYYLTENSHHQSHKLKNRLIKEGIKNHKCENCGITEWNNLPTPLELDHINGINTDNRLQNLRIICPNCHAQTETYRGKNKKK